MKKCYVNIPRMMIPREDVQNWAISAHPGREESERAAGNQPSVLRFLLPETVGNEEECIAGIRSSMFDALEETLEKLNRGAMLIEHTAGKKRRYGILAALDLDAYTMSEENAPVRSLQRFDGARAEALSRLREGAVLEFPAVALFYRDKKCKIVRALGENLEEVYSFDVGEQHIRGMFIPENVAWEVVEDMHPRLSPCFAVADGEEELAAAKLHWLRVKKDLTEDEADMHPARFLLAEFVNIYEEGTELIPVHRALSGVDPEALFSFLGKKKYAREGNCIRAMGRDPAAVIRDTDALIARFLQQNGGSVRYTREVPTDEGEIFVLMPAIEKEDIFSYAKEGKPLSAHSFEFDGCYRFEGREISYD